jgi:hypothetical protein
VSQVLNVVSEADFKIRLAHHVICLKTKTYEVSKTTLAPILETTEFKRIILKDKLKKC